MRKLLLISPAVVILGGCAALPNSIGTCTNPQRATPVVISYAQQNNMVRVQAAPFRIEADRGDLIRFQIAGSSGNLVSVSGKATDPDAAWITGNATSGSFYVCVPMTTTEGQVYSYEVDVDGIGFLDPEVRVRR
jgi:hypothetical protein